jgi:glutamate dehydrogenase/leucine dehydrogenase
MASLMAIRDADDKAAAVKHAQGKIADLKRQNPEAAQMLEKQLGAFVSNPASVPALLREDEIDAFLARGSDFGNYVNMGSAALDTAALLAGGTAAGPALAVAAPGVAVSAGGAAVLQEWERRKVEAELQRRRIRAQNGKGSNR